MYCKTPKPKNTAAKITALVCLILGASLFILANENLISLPWLAQITGIFMITASIYIASVYLLKQYTFIIEKSDIPSADGSLGYDFVITERRSGRDITVCRLGLEEISLAREVGPTNRKSVLNERKNKKRYSYDASFAPNRQLEITSAYDNEEISLLITYDEELLNKINGIK